MQTLKKMIFVNLEDKIGLKENMNGVMTVMRFTIHTGLKVTPFDIHRELKWKRYQELFARLDNIKRFGSTEANYNLRGTQWERRGDRPHGLGKKEEDS